jgi:hypothetical protein
MKIQQVKYYATFVFQRIRSTLRIHFQDSLHYVRGESSQNGLIARRYEDGAVMEIIAQKDITPGADSNVRILRSLHPPPVHQTEGGREITRIH